MRVLVVDDEYDIRYLVQAALEHCEVLTAADGPSALALLRHAKVDAVLLDVMMPGMDGFSVLRRIRADAQLRDLPVIMLTAKTGEHDHVQAFGDGADAYLTKPFGVDELDDTIALVATRTPSERTKVRAEELNRAQLLAQIEYTFGV
ncbi:MAG TPA: response regulator [Egibacteraceae bacterium]|nr:response regulator [Egibacteraceae bacterium]